MVVFDATYAVTPNYVPIYYLPWEDAGASIRLTIPRAAANKGPSNPIDPADPYLFFTAAIDGCSIFFRGTTQDPTIFHCGGTTGRATRDEQAQFWEAVMREFVGRDNGRGKQAKLGPLSPISIDKRDYIMDPNVTTKLGAGAAGIDHTTARAPVQARPGQTERRACEPVGLRAGPPRRPRRLDLFYAGERHRVLPRFHTQPCYIHPAGRIQVLDSCGCPPTHLSRGVSQWQ